MSAAQAAERGINLSLVIAEGTPHALLTDARSTPGKCSSTCLSNAVKHTRPGEISLTAEPGRGEQEAVRLYVKDNGPVIAPHNRERLFQSFTKAGQARSLRSRRERPRTVDLPPPDHF